MRTLSLLSLLILSALTAPCRADSSLLPCRQAVNAMEEKMAQYRRHRAGLELARSRYTDRVARCRAEGQEISTRLQKAAEALSCEAQKDVSRLDRRISDLGRECEVNYQQIRGMQANLKSSFSLVKDDLLGGVALFDQHPVGEEICGAEVRAVKDMVKVFVLLEGKIVDLGEDATKAAQDNGRLKEVGAQLASVTAGLGRNCENGTGSAPVLSAEGQRSVGAGAGSVPQGHSRNPSSDISGTREAREKARLADEILRAQ